MSKRRLGKGIDALLQGRPLEELSNMTTVLQVELDRLHPNPRQPRTRFDEDTLKELADSIREKGVIQPIIAEDRGDGTFTIVAGERRYRAARLAGLTQVPVISQDFSDEEKLEIALVENLQREDLNPIDEAHALESAMSAAGYTQDQLARRLGKSRSAVANTVRLLKLEPEIREALANGEISAGHARALLSRPDQEERLALFQRILSEGLSVREAELDGRPAEKTVPEPAVARPRSGTSAGEEPEDTPSIGAGTGSLEVPSPAAALKSPELQRVEDALVDALGTRVTIKGSDRKGTIQIEYYSTGDLDRLLEVLGVTVD